MAVMFADEHSLTLQGNEEYIYTKHNPTEKQLLSQAYFALIRARDL